MTSDCRELRKRITLLEMAGDRLAIRLNTFIQEGVRMVSPYTGENLVPFIQEALKEYQDERNR